MAGLRLQETTGEIPARDFPTHTAGRAWLDHYYSQGGTLHFYILAPGKSATTNPRTEEEPLWDTETKPAEPVTDWEV